MVTQNIAFSFTIRPVLACNKMQLMKELIVCSKIRQKMTDLDLSFSTFSRKHPPVQLWKVSGFPCG